MKLRMGGTVMNVPTKEVKRQTKNIDNVLGCFKVIGISPHTEKHGVREALKELMNLKYDDIRFIISDDVKSKLKGEFSDFGDISKSDVILTLGGDGTLLKAARQYAKYDIPFIGVNLGHLGYLTEAKKHNLKELVDKLRNNDYHIEERMMLRAEIIKNRKILNRYFALNDIVMTRKEILNMVSVGVKVNKQLLGKYFADGIIVATPTGSTAYSLSTGGPIIDPSMKAMMITPICPHSFDSRSIIIPSDKCISLEPDLEYNKETIVAIDGQDTIDMEKGMKVEIKLADISTKLIKLNDYNFYSVVQKKLSRK